MGDGTSKPIKQFVPENAILHRDETDLNDPITVQVVEAVFERSAILFELRVAGQLIETTAEHPFWVVDRGWTPVWELSIGDSLTTITGETVSVEGVHETDRRQTVYNLRVSDYHTDAVGCDDWGVSVWAHNRYLVEGLPDGSFVIRDSMTKQLLESVPGEPIRFTRKEAWQTAKQMDETLRRTSREFIESNPTSVKRPKVVDNSLSRIMDDIYKAEKSPDRIGTGSTADGLRFEKMTGFDFNDKIHGQAASERANRLRDWLKDHPHALPDDIDAARRVVADLEDAIALGS
ncbi:YD repeat protein OS=Isosphaera pallida (strain ATCC 43644 / DSM 9630 / IS1B) GN=Isop_2419 PE=4 SV=1: PT-HINT [Tuwongella immobilis]|uniref:Hint domain-containing protein n=2 Tax=Tuwongella immobilis TaxID=692036 RepID=A0A6C2YUT0_9BACT|nr:YD repeat protein OS=Isosphaera pallida (strain ATCC 43644 / DSM 9630 / IS1B) GN=Isop_2419 PE=4 SV=1: PT-HINT [Tuwongella immobilis]VTS07764.1 YD repeat protein OS=Isosphaera pallida (strain ATCC 43644 / DSM 9630 / IS1B) GN=Isop_2419 PE=4 SV=1: PT-HINT [Tuwongella immobilis]